MLMRYKMLADIYECLGVECQEDGCVCEPGHSTRTGLKINVTASSNHEARRKTLEQCYAQGASVRKLVVKEITSIS